MDSSKRYAASPFFLLHRQHHHLLLLSCPTLPFFHFFLSFFFSFFFFFSAVWLKELLSGEETYNKLRERAGAEGLADCSIRSVCWRVSKVLNDLKNHQNVRDLERYFLEHFRPQRIQMCGAKSAMTGVQSTTS